MVRQTKLNNARRYFWLDVILFLSFVLSLVPQITGIWAHQWLGIGMSVGVLVHLAWHAPWIRAMLRSYLKPLPRRSRANVLVDTLLGVASALLLASGVLMSPTFTPDPIRWARAMHEAVWIPFAGLMGLHLALHWIWIGKHTRLWVLGWRPEVAGQPALVMAGVPASLQGRRVSRRRFLALGGGAAAAFLLGSARLSSLGVSNASTGEAGCPFGLVNDPYPGRCSRYTDRNGNGLCDFSEQGEDAAVAPSVAESATQAPVTSSQQAVPEAKKPAATATPVTGPVACPFGLVNDPYPGRCRRYTDRNGNGYCDFSEPGSGSGIR